jgi:hypothetical protein
LIEEGKIQAVNTGGNEPGYWRIPVRGLHEIHQRAPQL